MLVEGLVKFLGDDTGMKTQLGTPLTRGDKSSGIFPVIAPERATMPYVVLQQVGGGALQTSFQGTGRLQEQRWRFSSYGTSYKQAKKLAEVLKLALISLDGTLAAGSVEVHGSWQELEADTAETLTHATIFATHIDFKFIYLDTQA